GIISQMPLTSSYLILETVCCRLPPSCLHYCLHVSFHVNLVSLFLPSVLIDCPYLTSMHYILFSVNLLLLKNLKNFLTTVCIRRFLTVFLIFLTLNYGKEISRFSGFCAENFVANRFYHCLQSIHQNLFLQLLISSFHFSGRDKVSTHCTQNIQKLRRTTHRPHLPLLRHRRSSSPYHHQHHSPPQLSSSNGGAVLLCRTKTELKIHVAGVESLYTLSCFENYLCKKLFTINYTRPKPVTQTYHSLIMTCGIMPKRLLYPNDGLLFIHLLFAYLLCSFLLLLVIKVL
ncbi:hypothetical protein L9F63_026414, partial [Diploptera punctata]